MEKPQEHCAKLHAPTLLHPIKMHFFHEKFKGKNQKSPAFTGDIVVPWRMDASGLFFVLACLCIQVPVINT